MNSEFNIPRKILLLLRKHENNPVISPDTFQHLINLLTFYKKRKALGDVCMTPASSVTGFKGLLFVCFSLLIYCRNCLAFFFAFTKFCYNKESRHAMESVTKKLPSLPVQFILKHFHVLHSIRLHTGFCKTKIQNWCNWSQRVNKTQNCSTKSQNPKDRSSWAASNDNILCLENTRIHWTACLERCVGRGRRPPGTAEVGAGDQGLMPFTTCFQRQRIRCLAWIPLDRKSVV